MELELANIATGKKNELNGFKILGLFPFFLTLISSRTQINLVSIQNQISKIVDRESIDSDYFNLEIQEKFEPLFKEYCLTGLINSKDQLYERRGNNVKLWFFKKFIKRKLEDLIDECSYEQLFSLYAAIRKFNDPGFFLVCWKSLNHRDNMILSEEKPS